ncbi:uncharacterized protein [Diabrotica undecimpunctata]|uniref:uncharacterized protein isoform X1 n=1 Tax=Diabrotica undecimpunctata TaxID=50387 RepID=UPI003B63D8AC
MNLHHCTLLYLLVILFQISSSSPSGYQGAPIIKPFGGALDTVENVITNIAKSKAISPAFPDSGRTRAVLELQSKESLPLQLDNKYGTLQDFAARIFNPEPVVDTAQEYEKYGNDAATQRRIANALIGGFEGFSNVLNAAVEVPFVTTKQFGKTLTTSLNTVGGKLVGLS